MRSFVLTVVTVLLLSTVVGAQEQPPLTLKFINKTDAPATLYWIENETPEGKKSYAVVQPGKETTVQTFPQHRWQFTTTRVARQVIATQDAVYTLGDNTTPVPSLPQKQTVNDLILQKVNEYRASRGLGMLRNDAYIQSLCQQHSQDMANRYNGQLQLDHNGFNTRFASARQRNPSITTAAENVFGGNDGSDEQIALQALNGWKNSPGHNANMLNPQMTISGLGVVKRNGRVYITQMFTSGQ